MPKPWRKNSGICPTCGRRGYRPDIPEVLLGTAIRRAREEMGWSQEQLGTLLTPALCRTRVVAPETGNRRIDLMELRDIARVLGKDAAYFLAVMEPTP